MSELGKKVDFAVKLLRTAELSAAKKALERESINELRSFKERNGGLYIPNGTVEISYSSGKDSDIIAHLAGMAGIRHTIIRKDTGIDPSFSNAHARSKGAVILSPKSTFFHLIEKRGFPTRRARFCCELLKEYPVNRVAVHGIRRSESSRRTEQYHEPQICRVYGRKDNKVEVFLPILEWSDSDVKDFIQSEGIKCHPMYYDSDGRFCVERRLGCACCPLQSTHKLREAFKEHPLFVKAYITHGRVWWNNSPNTRSHQKFGDSLYDLFFHNVFCDSYQEYVTKTTGLFGKMDCKAFLEDYFKVDLP